MGGLWSTPTKECTECSSSDTNKKRNVTSLLSLENSRLIPNLPNEISIQIFARIPRVHYLGMKLVSQTWKKFLTSHELFNLRKQLGLTEEWLYLLTKLERTKLVLYTIDPLSKNWQKLPPIPNRNKEDERKWGFSDYVFPGFIKVLFGRREVLEELPYSGCSIGTINGCLYVLGGFSNSCAMSCVYRYNPIPNTWDEVASMTVPRAYCKTSVLNDKLYVIGGLKGVGQGGLIPLHSGEIFDQCSNSWSELPKMPFSKAQIAPVFYTEDMLTPIATGMSTYRGKLCVPQSLYLWPTLVEVGGEIFDPERNMWEEMPIGMGEGWPARQAGTKLSVIVDGELYALDPSSSLESGKMKVYDKKKDVWKVVIEKVPICDFSDSECPYLLANIYRTIHVITKDADCNIVILRADVCDDLSSLFDSKMDTVVWKLVTNSDFGPAELVSCQVLDI